VLERHIPLLCEYLSSSVLAPVVLQIFVDMAMSGPATFIPHSDTLTQLAETQPLYITQVIQIMGAMATVSEVS
jgi:hypothetical protein